MYSCAQHFHPRNIIVGCKPLSRKCAIQSTCVQVWRVPEVATWWLLLTLITCLVLHFWVRKLVLFGCHCPFSWGQWEEPETKVQQKFDISFAAFVFIPCFPGSHMTALLWLCFCVCWVPFFIFPPPPPPPPPPPQCRLRFDVTHEIESDTVYHISIPMKSMLFVLSLFVVFVSNQLDWSCC